MAHASPSTCFGDTSEAGMVRFAEIEGLIATKLCFQAIALHFNTYAANRAIRPYIFCPSYTGESDATFTPATSAAAVAIDAAQRTRLAARAYLLLPATGPRR